MKNSTLDFYAVVQGDFGRVEVVKNIHNLVMRSQPHTYFSYWLGGGLAHSRVGQHLVQLGPDMALGVNSHASHDLQLENANIPAIFLNLYLNEDWFDAQFCSIAPYMVLPQPCVEITPAVREISSKLLKHMVSSSRLQHLCIESDVALLASKTIESARTIEQLRDMPLRRSMIDYRLRRAIAHMKDNMSNLKIVEEVAEIVGLSRSRFYELFQDQLGTSPLVFWNSLRLEEALTRLNDCQENMTSLSMELGFSTPGNFSRFFRDHRGVTPSTYRRVCHAF